MGKKSNKRTVSIKPGTKRQRSIPRDPELIFQFTLQRIEWRRLGVIITLISFLAGIGSGYLFWGRREAKLGEQAAEIVKSANQDEHAAHIALSEQVNPPGGYTLPASIGDVGPQLLAAGAIDKAAFVQLYEQASRPLSAAQLAILEQGSNSQIVLNKQNAYFLLNFFWALGLSNQNPILTEGPMMQGGNEQINRFASTGGWTLATKPLLELYASTPIVRLTEAQQRRLEEVASQVYRPCCNNPTHFPDCNHGMAMLGLLELIASQGASTEEMFDAAKYANAFWYPSQSLELAQYFQSTQGRDFAEADSRELVSQTYSSSSGFQVVHQWLADNSLLPNSSGSGSNCGV